MKNSPFVYVVTMYRYGDRELHSYVHGIYQKKQKAIDEAKFEKEYRGGNKYYPEVLEMALNDSNYKKIILDLPDWKNENV